MWVDPKFLTIVLHDQAMADDCKRCFAGLYVLTIGIFCPLEILEKREQERGDQVIGRARGLFDIVHNFYDYDVDIDTSKMTVAESVNLIEKTIESRSS